MLLEKSTFTKTERIFPPHLGKVVTIVFFFTTTINNCYIRKCGLLTLGQFNSFMIELLNYLMCRSNFIHSFSVCHFPLVLKSDIFPQLPFNSYLGPSELVMSYLAVIQVTARGDR